MKTYEETAKSALRKAEAERARSIARRKTALRVLVPIVGICCASALCFGVLFRKETLRNPLPKPVSDVSGVIGVTDVSEPGKVVYNPSHGDWETYVDAKGVVEHSEGIFRGKVTNVTYGLHVIHEEPDGLKHTKLKAVYEVEVLELYKGELGEKVKVIIYGVEEAEEHFRLLKENGSENDMAYFSVGVRPMTIGEEAVFCINPDTIEEGTYKTLSPSQYAFRLDNGTDQFNEVKLSDLMEYLESEAEQN